MTDNKIKTNTLNEAIKAIEFLSENIGKVKKDTYYWKWNIIALHNSLQAFMVCALEGGNGLNVIKAKLVRKWLAAYDRGSGEESEVPLNKLEWFPNLYKKIKSNDMKMFVQSRAFYANHEHDKSVKRLSDLRNNFIHFTPKGWTILLGGMTKIFKDCIEIIEFLVFESNNIRNIEENKEYISKILREIKKELDKTS